MERKTTPAMTEFSKSIWMLIGDYLKLPDLTIQELDHMQYILGLASKVCNNLIVTYGEPKKKKKKGKSG